ncbi:MAG TPA: hypothetical protein VFL70_04655, partial [Bacteroidia bacterium]|nr:hypothetical protein [Bacteroidia bacterium]
MLIFLAFISKGMGQASNEGSKKISLLERIKGKKVLNVTKDPFSKKEKKKKLPKQKSSFKSSSASGKDYGEKSKGKRVKIPKQKKQDNVSNDGFA